MFSYTADKEIRTDDLCLDVSRLNGPVVMLKCHHMKGNQMFEYDAEVRLLTYCTLIFLCISHTDILRAEFLHTGTAQDISK